MTSRRADREGREDWEGYGDRRPVAASASAAMSVSLTVPVPVPGCPVCTELAIRRDDARARFDRSAVTDSDVLLGRHLRTEHDASVHRLTGAPEPR